MMICLREMKFSVVVVLVFILGCATFGQSSINEVLVRLSDRADATYRYQNDAVMGYEIRRDQLLNSKSVGVTPTFFTTPRSLSEGRLRHGTTATYNSGKINSSLSFVTGDKPVQTVSSQLLYTILSDTKGRVVQIDSLIDLTREKAKLTREAILFNDFKRLLNSRVNFQYLTAENEVRKEISRRANEFLTNLHKIVATGVIPRNSVQSLMLFIKNNELRMSAIQLEKSLVSSTVSYDLGIDSVLFNSIDVVGLLSMCDLTKGCTLNDYSWRLDSLNNVIQWQSAKEQNNDSWKVSAGGGISFENPSEPSQYTTSLIAQVSYSFNKKKLPENIHLKRQQVEDITSDSKSLLDSYEQSAKEQAKEATAWIGSTLARISLGETGIIYEITDNLGAIQNQQLAYFSLKNSYLQRELLRLKSLDQIPNEMRGAR